MYSKAESDSLNKKKLWRINVFFFGYFLNWKCDRKSVLKKKERNMPDKIVKSFSLMS
jgi:hypothetical protein